MSEDAPKTEMSPFGRIDLPALSSSLKDVYGAGSFPLAIVFLAAIIFIGLIARGVIETLPIVMYLIGGLIAFGGILFLTMNWFAYRQWREELKARMENRKLEMDLYLKMSTANSEMQDKFILGMIGNLGELFKRPNGVLEAKSLVDSLGGLVKEFGSLRNQVKLPGFEALTPVSISPNQQPPNLGSPTP